MNTIDIRDFFEKIGHPISQFNLGDFDTIGEFTARKRRDPNSPLYKSVGAYFRPNYERGLLIYALIKKFNISSILEIGTGRGYFTVCAAKAFYDAGIQGTITSVDPAFSRDAYQQIMTIFPQPWTNSINFVAGKSQDIIPGMNEKFDLVYIDGDHSYEGTKLDWELVREKFTKFVLFDDYLMPTHENDGGIQCAKAIDEICAYEKELILMDRRIFHDDRGLSDLDYGQVLLRHPDFNMNDELGLW